MMFNEYFRIILTVFCIPCSFHSCFPYFSDTREFPWPDACGKISHSSVTTLDFKTKLWTSLEDGSNATNQKNACMEILSTIESKVSIDGCLELRGYPLLTQFNVGLVYLLGHMFEQVRFQHNNLQLVNRLS